MRCEQCGSDTRSSGPCRDVFHALLAAEHGDRRLGAWHGVVVSAYFLQHRDEALPRHRDGQWRMLQLFRAEGLDALWRFASRQRARNGHRTNLPYDMTPLERFEALPDVEAPTAFTAGFPTLPGSTGDFVGDGYEAYERRLTAIVDATLTAWRAAAGSPARTTAD